MKILKEDRLGRGKSIMEVREEVRTIENKILRTLLQFQDDFVCLIAKW